jgi:hypothetical protein
MVVIYHCKKFHKIGPSQASDTATAKKAKCLEDFCIISMTKKDRKEKE